MFEHDLSSELYWFVVRYTNGFVSIINSDSIESSNAEEYIEEYLRDSEGQLFQTQNYGEAVKFWKEVNKQQ